MLFIKHLKNLIKSRRTKLSLATIHKLSLLHTQIIRPTLCAVTETQTNTAHNEYLHTYTFRI